MENGGIVKTARRILVVTSAKQRPLGRIFSMHSPSIRPGVDFLGLLIFAGLRIENTTFAARLEKAVRVLYYRPYTDKSKPSRSTPN